MNRTELPGDDARPERFRRGIVHGAVKTPLCDVDPTAGCHRADRHPALRHVIHVVMAAAVAVLIGAPAIHAGDGSSRAAAETALAPRASLSEWLAGTWLLTKLYDEDETGDEVEKWGLSPQGLISFRRDGRFVFQLADDLGMGLCLAYAGTYAVSDGRLQLQSDTRTSGEKDETAPVADIALIEEDVLALTSAVQASLTGSFYSRTVWQRTPDEARPTPCRSGHASQTRKPNGALVERR